MVARVLVSMRVAVSPERAFDVFTRRIDDWWIDNPLFRHTPRSPGRLAFLPASDETQSPRRLVETLANGKVFTIGEVSCWEPGRRLALDWRVATFGPDQSTQVDILFELVDGQTRITVTHSGWDSIPQPHLARHGFPLMVFQTRLSEHWRANLNKMCAVVTQNSLPSSSSPD